MLSSNRKLSWTIGTGVASTVQGPFNWVLLLNQWSYFNTLEESCPSVLGRAPFTSCKGGLELVSAQVGTQLQDSASPTTWIYIQTMEGVKGSPSV
jgi:hypothetical protein